MKDFFTELRTIDWWVTVFVVGVIISVFANYLPKLIVKGFGISKGLLKRYSDRRINKIERLAEYYLSTPDWKIILEIRFFGFTILCILTLVLSLLLSEFGYFYKLLNAKPIAIIASSFLSSVLLVLSFLLMNQFISTKDILTQIHRKILADIQVNTVTDGSAGTGNN